MTHCITGCIFVYINDGVDSNARGTINGLAQMTVSMTRSVGSILPSAILSASLQGDIVGGNLVFILLSLLTAGGILLAVRLPKK